MSDIPEQARKVGTAMLAHGCLWIREDEVQRIRTCEMDHAEMKVEYLERVLSGERVKRQELEQRVKDLSA